MKNDQVSTFKAPPAYFITFTTYGTWLHCDTRSSVDLKHNVYNTQRLEPNEKKFKKNQAKLSNKPFVMNSEQRKNVLQTVISVCNYCQWRLFAVNVRTNHVHIVVQAKKSPEDVMLKIKSYASRHLNLLNPENKGRPYWTRHGSTKYIFAKEYFYYLIDYVVNQQGENIACYYEAWFDDFIETGIIPTKN